MPTGHDFVTSLLRIQSGLARRQEAHRHVGRGAGVLMPIFQPFEVS